jgi:hypothetical protein
MNASDISSNIINELKSVKKSNVSLVEAVHKIDLVVAMGEKFTAVESQQAHINEEFNRFEERIEDTATVSAMMTLVQNKLTMFEERIINELGEFK